MKTQPAILSLLFTLLLTGCALPRSHQTRDAAVTHFVIVRHAEKASDHPKDPNLSSIGHATAQRLAKRLRDRKLTAVYATAYKRSQQTAAVVAQSQGLNITTYDASEPATEIAHRLRNQHVHGHVLVIGHSNTVPAIAAALCDCVIESMRDDEYDRMIEIDITKNEKTGTEVRTRQDKF